MQMAHLAGLSSRSSRALVVLAAILLLGGACAGTEPAGLPAPEADARTTRPAPNVLLDARGEALSGPDGASPALTDASEAEDVLNRDRVPLDASADQNGTVREDALPSPEPANAARSGGCQNGAGLPEGKGTITVGALNRSYVLRLPAGYTNRRAWPLVLALHPNENPVSYWDGTSGDRAIRPAFGSKAIIVLPQGRNHVWNDNLPLDLAYFDALLARLKSELCIDTSRIFSMGFSGGGSFSGVLGCHRKDIRAIATGGAVTYFDPKDCVGTPAAWITIGDKETSSSREGFRNFWRTRNGCKSTSTAVTAANCVAYACPADKPVHFCAHPAGHLWPSFGTAAVWAFFAQF